MAFQKALSARRKGTGLRRAVTLMVGVLVASLAAAGTVVLFARLLQTPKPAYRSGDARVAEKGAAADTTASSQPWTPALTDSHPLPDVLIDPKVVVEKESRRLTVFSDGIAVKRYRAALGGAPVGHKSREGDGRTPEGEYYVCSKNPQSKFRLSLGLSYPNEDDADAGLADGVISKREHKSIITAIRRMQRPPWNTALGGEIMIHGNGSGRGDWTYGCVALDDPDIDELFTALPLGTPVSIVP
jgi:murein L,D-transpeptidase YafK